MYKDNLRRNDNENYTMYKANNNNVIFKESQYYKKINSFFYHKFNLNII